ncbi:MAG: PASTA domain-containing protein [Spirochaetaceae bacterium]|nr:PASTA domain-containing protein [Spirochaetaceae bacterium]
MEINKNLKKSRIYVFILLLGIFSLYILYTYGKQTLTPYTPYYITKDFSERGSILDRNGKELAIQTNFYHLKATPSQISKEHLVSIDSILSPYLDYTKGTITKLVENSTKDYVYLKKRLEQKDYDSITEIIENNSLKGLSFDVIQGRTYPEKTLASHVVGFMGNDGVGLSGLEASMDEILTPQENGGIQAKGKDIYTTIDANLQYKLEKIAQNAMNKTKAESIILLATKAKTGEILSYISLPQADLSAYSQASAAETTNRPAAYAYEPGSVFKIFSVAAFLNSGAISPTDTFFCDGKYQIETASGENVKITCLGYHGNITAEQALQYSCNDALAQMAERIPNAEFIRYLRSFGFGRRSYIELHGETRGFVKDDSDKTWSGRSKPTMSIGQEISVSALQMVQAASIFANKGTLVPLTLIHKITDKENNTYQPQKQKPIPQLISEKTAQELLKYMASTAKDGTGSKASLNDITLGVKTGTAQIYNAQKGTYSTTDFLSNCIALFPIENPEIILYIVISKAQGETYAGRIVAPVIKEAADTIIDHLGFTRNNAESYIHSGVISIDAMSNITIEDTVPNFYGVPKKLIIPLLTTSSVPISIVGDGWVVEQNPLPGTEITEQTTIELFLE